MAEKMLHSWLQQALQEMTNRLQQEVAGQVQQQRASLAQTMQQEVAWQVQQQRASLAQLMQQDMAIQLQKQRVELECCWQQQMTAQIHGLREHYEAQAYHQVAAQLPKLLPKQFNKNAQSLPFIQQRKIDRLSNRVRMLEAEMVGLENRLYKADFYSDSGFSDGEEEL